MIVHDGLRKANISIYFRRRFKIQTIPEKRLIFLRKNHFFGNNMKNPKTKVIVTGAPLAGRCADDGSSAPVRTIEMKNLRHDSSGCLVPVGKYRAIEGLDGIWQPLGHIGQRLVAVSGTQVRAVSEEGDASMLNAEDTLPGEALNAVSCQDGTLIAMTPAGPARITIEDENIKVTRLYDPFPPIILSATDSSPVTADIAERSLSRSYTSGRLGTADSHDVIADITAAYLHIAAESSAAGLFVQPILARYKLRDREGHILYTSGPVLLCHSSGAQCCDTVSIYSDDRKTLKPYSIAAKSWRLSATFSAATPGLASEAATAEIWLTPQFHPCEPGGAGTVTVSRGTSADNPYLQARVPGLQNGLGSKWKDRASSLIMKAIARIDDIEERVAVITEPFGSTERTIDIAVSPDPDVASVSRRLSAALKAPVRRFTAEDVLLSTPHSFSASVAATDAATVAWGDITIRRFTGYAIRTIAAGNGTATPWRIYTKVRFSDGTSLARTDSGTSGVPDLFSPVLTYPSPDAVEVDMQITTGGTETTARFPLTPDESGRCAVYIAPAVKPFTPNNEVISDISFTNPPQDHLPDIIAIADASAPLTIISSGRPGGGEIRSMEAFRIASQSWEFGRSRFIAGTTKGLCSVGVSADRRSLSLRNIFNGEVSLRNSLVAAGTSVFALAGNPASLVEIPATGSARVYAGPGNYKTLAFNTRCNELTAFCTDGSARIFCLDENGASYTRSGESVIAAMDNYIVTDTGVFRIDMETASRMPVTISFFINPCASDYGRITMLEAFIASSDVNAMLKLEGCGVTDSYRWLILKADIRGEIRSPVIVHPLARPARNVIITFEGIVSSDFRFKTFRFHTL